MKFKLVKYTIQLLLLFTFNSPKVFAQIKGIITDLTTNQPVIGASVYINNTTYGCQSNMEGQFDLEVFPELPFQIIISSVGYESSTFKVNEKQISNIKITLKPKAVDIGEVLILAPEKDGWAKYGAEFTKNFIGYSAFAKECEIINKKDIEFRYDQKANKLLVSAQKPLKIKNKATGYLITYWLDDYEMDYRSKRLFFKGNAQFESLESKKEKTINQWKANRKAAFKGSLNHFMRSVYNNTIYEDSFELRVYKRIPAEEYGKIVPFKIDHLLAGNDSLIGNAVKSFLHYSDSDLLQLQPTIEKWLDAEKAYKFTLDEKRNDSLTATRYKVSFNYNIENPKEKLIQYFDYEFIPEDTTYAAMMGKVHFTDLKGNAIPLRRQKPVTFAYLWTYKMPLDSFVTRTNHEVILRFKDYIHVTYLKEKEEISYIQNQFPVTHNIPETQQSIISIENTDGIHIQADGNFYNPYDLIVEEYWSYEKMDKMMPLDYQFEE